MDLIFFTFMALVIGFAIVVAFVVFSPREEEVEVYEEVREPVFLQILVPRENDKTPLAAEQMFASIHGILRDAKKSMDMLSFEIVSTFEGGIKFYVAVPSDLAQFVQGQIYAQYPNAEIRVVEDPTQHNTPVYDAENRPAQIFVTTGEIELAKEQIFPIKTFRDFEVDPLSAITSAMGNLQNGEEIWLQVLLRPVGNYWQDLSKKYISAVRDGRPIGGKSASTLLFEVLGGLFKAAISSPKDKPEVKQSVRLAPGQEEELRQIENKMLKVGFELGIRVITKAPDQANSDRLLRDIVASFKQYTTAHLNSFEYTMNGKTPQILYEEYLMRHLDADPLDIVNVEELASIFHLPNQSVETPSINWSRAKKSEPPMSLPLNPDDDINFFGETDYRGSRQIFGIKRTDRRRHMYLLGKTGVGKSTLFKNMIIADILRGEGVCYVDPHGQDIEELLEYIPEHRLKDVVYFNPADTDFPVACNMLELEDMSQRDLLTDGVVSVFKKEFGDSWGPRLQYILQNAIATLIEARGMTILGVQRILVDPNYRKFVLKQVKDPILLNFWNEEYAKMEANPKLITEAVAPIQNKVGRFISSAVIRNIVGQVKSTIHFRKIMDEKKIFLVNLAQGKIGEESASLLGGLIITKLQSAALQRVDTPEELRTDFFLYVDEFQNFATDSFAKILSEARKFKLNLVMTNQYIEQIPLTVRNAIFGNVGTLGTFVVSQADARILANEYAPVFTAEDLVSLEAHSMYLKLCIDGMTSKPFSAKSLDYRSRYPKYALRNLVVESSRNGFGMQKAVIEDKIERWSKTKYDAKGNREQ